MKIEEIEALCEAASSSPWGLCLHLRDKTVDKTCGCGYRGGIWGAEGEFMVCEMGSTEIKGQEGLEPPRYRREQEIANAEFIAASRTLMPKLLEVAKAAKDFCNNFAEFETITDGPIIDAIYDALEELEKE